MALYDDLSPEKAVCYVRECTSLFGNGEEITAHEISFEEGEGYVNHLYKITGSSGKTVILKQAKPYFRFLGSGDALPHVAVERSRIEADTYRIREVIIPQYLLKLLHIDHENNLFIQEYCDFSSMRSQLREGLEFPFFPSMIGEYIAKSAFYTSELFLDQSEHHELSARFVNSGMRRIMEELIFEFATLGSEDDVREFLKTHYDFQPALLKDKEFLIELLSMRDVYMKKGECLVHGDLHTSNILISQKQLYVFDMEYTHMGAYTGDIGYLCGNLVYAFVAGHFNKQKNMTERQTFCHHIISYISELVDVFERQFRECWKADAKPLYRDNPEYMDVLFRNFIPEISGFIGLQTLLRVLHHPGIQDFDDIKSDDDIEQARTLCVIIGVSLLKHRQKMQSIRQVVDLIEGSARDFFMSLRQAA